MPAPKAGRTLIGSYGKCGQNGRTVLAKEFTGEISAWPGALRRRCKVGSVHRAPTFQAAIASRSWRAARASNAAASLARVKFAMSLVLEPQRTRHMPDHLASGSTVAITYRPSLNSSPFHTSFILRQLQRIDSFFAECGGSASTSVAPSPSCHPRRTEHGRSTHFARNAHQRGNSGVTNSCYNLFPTRAGL